jgi:putative endonuclease
MKADHLVVGERGEGRALDHLIAQGWRMLDRNWRCRGGELDLVVTRADVLAFVEVKTRETAEENEGFQPEDAVDPTKVRRLVRAARLWLLAHESEIDGLFPRFDIMTIAGRGAATRIEHLEDAFEAPGG